MIRLPGALLNILSHVVLDVFSAEEKHGAEKGHDKLEMVGERAVTRFTRGGFIASEENTGLVEFIEILVSFINGLVALLNYLGIFKRTQDSSEPD